MLSHPYFSYPLGPLGMFFFRIVLRLACTREACWQRCSPGSPDLCQVGSTLDWKGRPPGETSSVALCTAANHIAKIYQPHTPQRCSPCATWPRKRTATPSPHRAPPLNCWRLAPWLSEEAPRPARCAANLLVPSPLRERTLRSCNAENANMNCRSKNAASWGFYGI